MPVASLVAQMLQSVALQAQMHLWVPAPDAGPIAMPVASLAAQMMQSVTMQAQTQVWVLALQDYCRASSKPGCTDVAKR